MILSREQDTCVLGQTRGEESRMDGSDRAEDGKWVQ